MTTAQAIKEMMDAWAVIETAAKAQYPMADKEEIYAICKSAMNNAIRRA